MRRVAALVVFAALPLASTACGSSSSTGTPSTPTSLTMSGLVTDALTGAGVASATVTVQGATATTGSDGRYTLTPTSAGPATVTAQHQGYDTLTETVTLAAGANTVNLALSPSVAASAAGTWAGGWQNNTFATSGSLAATISVETIAQTFQANVAIGGNVFGLGTPPAQNFTGAYTVSTNVNLTLTSMLLGSLALTISPTGQINGSANSIMGGVVSNLTITGTATPSVISINYTLTLIGGGTATGTATLTKQ